MIRNVGAGDRVARAVGGSALLICAVVAPWTLGARIALFVAPAAYMLFTAAAGWCGGYALMRKSTCMLAQKDKLEPRPR
jgi:hypothetical protein